MKQPLWKKLVSYVYEFSVETVEGKFNPYLEVLYSRGRYQLATENAIYSHEDLYTNYFQAFNKIDLGRQSFDNVLLDLAPPCASSSFWISVNLDGSSSGNVL